MRTKPYILEIKTSSVTAYTVCFGTDKEAAEEALKSAIDKYNAPEEVSEESKAESERKAILELLSFPSTSGKKGKTKYQIKKALTRKKGSPFRSYTMHGEAAAVIDKTIDYLLESGEITCSGQLSNKKYAKA